jgi:hypothetical protein
MSIKRDECIHDFWEKPRHRSEDNIKMELREIGSHGMDWIHLPRIGISGRLLQKQ